MVNRGFILKVETEPVVCRLCSHNEVNVSVDQASRRTLLLFFLLDSRTANGTCRSLALAGS